MPAGRAELLATRLAADLARVLEVEPTQISDPTTFIATAARAFEARHRYYDSSE